MAFDRRNGWKTMTKVIKILGWETPMELGKQERKEALRRVWE